MEQPISHLPPQASQHILLFSLGEPRYALNLAVVERVIQAVDVLPLPQAPPLVLGVINVQGEIIPVVDIRRCFGLEAREVIVTDQFILARTAVRRVAVMADAVSGVVEPNARQWVAASAVLPGAAFIDAVVKLDDTLILVCDLDQILALETERTLAETLASALPVEAR